jgi:hypothetical protein
MKKLLISRGIIKKNKQTKKKRQTTGLVFKVQTKERKGQSNTSDNIFKITSDMKLLQCLQCRRKPCITIPTATIIIYKVK